MNSLINRLNPKTTNFESTGTGSSVGAIIAADVCIALSYSKMSPISCELIRFKCLNDATDERINALAVQILEPILNHRYRDIPYRDLYACMRVALIEFCKVPATYKPSVRNRAVLVGLSKSYFSEHKLTGIVDSFAAGIEYDYDLGVAALSRQLSSLKSMSN